MHLLDLLHTEMTNLPTLLHLSLLELVKAYPFVYLEPEKDTLYSGGASRIGHFREYSPPPAPGRKKMSFSRIALADYVSRSFALG